MERTADHERVIDDTLMPKYKPRIEALLRSVGTFLMEEGFIVEQDADNGGVPKVWDMCGDDFKWSLVVWRPEADREQEEDCIDISVEIAEAIAYGDDAHDGYGVNFGLDIVEWGGLILGGLTPYNYTDDCWVDARDEDAVDRRFTILESADISEIPFLILNERN